MLKLYLIDKKRQNIVRISRKILKFVTALKSVCLFEFSQCRQTDSQRRAES